MKEFKITITGNRDEKGYVNEVHIVTNEDVIHSIDVMFEGLTDLFIQSVQTKVYKPLQAALAVRTCAASVSANILDVAGKGTK